MRTEMKAATYNSVRSGKCRTNRREGRYVMPETTSGLKKMDGCRLMVPQSDGMKVPGIVHVRERRISVTGSDESPKRAVNVAHARGKSNHPGGKNGKAGPVFWRILVCFLFVIVTSLYAATNDAGADKVQKVKEEVKQGVQETKAELKKVPEGVKKAGQEVRRQAGDVKKTVEADIEEGKRNVRSLTK